MNNLYHAIQTSAECNRGRGRYRNRNRNRERTRACANQRQRGDHWAANIGSSNSRNWRARHENRKSADLRQARTMIS